MRSKRREISKLSLSIFSSGQFININLFCFVFFAVIIYIRFLEHCVPSQCLGLNSTAFLNLSGAIWNRQPFLIRGFCWLNNYLLLDVHKKSPFRLNWVAGNWWLKSFLMRSTCIGFYPSKIGTFWLLRAGSDSKCSKYSWYLF